MNKLFTVLILIIVITVILVIIPNSPLCKPILHQLEKAAEKNWKSKITYSDARINLWKGEMAFNELEIESLEDTDASWSLAVRNLAVEIDYPAWFMDNLKLNKLMLHDIIFSRNEKKGSGNQLTKMLSDVAGKKKAEEKSKTIESKAGILIKHLIIQGKLELETVYGSGKTHRVKIESLNIKKKDVRFDGRPDTFMSSILKGAS